MAGPRLEWRRPRFWIWTGVVAGVIVILMVALLWVTGEPWFCGSCHEMQPEVNGWAAGTHKEVSCFACHSEPGPVGYLNAHIGAGMRDLWVHFTRRPDKIIPSGPQIVPPKRCLACHKDTQTGKAPPFPSPAKFPDHPAKTANCAECHRDSIHGPGP